MKGIFHKLICAASLAALSCSCFTGIESTPRISAGDVRKRDAANQTPEQLFLSDIRSERPADWKRGKRFVVTDDKVSIIFAPGFGNADSLCGHDLVFERFIDVPSVTGDVALQAVFTVDGRDGELRYPVDVSADKLSERQRLEVPFSVERSIVERVDSAMRDSVYYISTPKWFSAANDKAIVGKRHIPVRILKVIPGTYIYPLKVYFRPLGGSDDCWLPMTVGADRAATRNFSTVFNFDDPRKRYPQISDETWELIINSKVREGMTRDECRLALGAPNSYRTIPVINAVVEQWNYDDGIYLIFEDGLLSRFRI